VKRGRGRSFKIRAAPEGKLARIRPHCHASKRLKKGNVHQLFKIRRKSEDVESLQGRGGFNSKSPPDKISAGRGSARRESDRDPPRKKRGNTLKGQCRGPLDRKAGRALRNSHRRGGGTNKYPVRRSRTAASQGPVSPGDHSPRKTYVRKEERPKEKTPLNADRRTPEPCNPGQGNGACGRKYWAVSRKEFHKSCLGHKGSRANSLVVGRETGARGWSKTGGKTAAKVSSTSDPAPALERKS